MRRAAQVTAGTLIIVGAVIAAAGYGIAWLAGAWFEETPR